MAASLIADLRYALRALRHAPGFTATVCGVLALGIGANSALFTVVHRVLLEPLPFAEPERLVEIHERHGSGGPNAISYPNYLDWVKQQRTFENLAFAAVVPRLLPGPEGSEQAPVAFVTGNFFETYRVGALAGRTFGGEDDRPEAAPVAILSHGFWKDRFGGDAGVVGKSIRIDDLNATIVGVLPDFPWHREAKLFVPVAHGAGPLMLNRRENHNSSSVTGRLKVGESLEQGRADLAAIAGRLRAAYPIANRDIGIHAVTLHEWVTGGSKRTILALFGAVAILLLLACVNVANMMLARSMSRAKEFTVRLALGASRSDIVRQMLTECAVFGIGGAVLGLAVSRVLLPALATFAPSSISPRLGQPDWTVFGFTAAACAACTLIFGAAPAYAVSCLEPGGGLKERSAAGQSGHRWLRSGLVTSQVALALVLLAGAGLLLRSMSRLLGEDPGFRTDQVVMVRVSLPGGDDDLARLAERFAVLVERIRALPGVRGAASISIAPFAEGNSNAQIMPEGFELGPGVSIPAADYRSTSPEYFQTMGIPILRGRAYSKTDGMIARVGVKGVMKWFSTARYQVVINQSMAKRFWPGQDPVGRSFRFGPPSLNGALMTVCGVAADVRQRGLQRAPQPMFYVSSWMYPWPEQTFLVRSAAGAGALTQTLRRTVLAAESGAVVSEAKTFEGMVEELTAERRSNLAMMSAFAGLALLLAALGIYGVMAYVAGLRRREFAVRMALGATGWSVLRTILGDGAKLIAAGLAIGMAAAVWLSRLITGMLYGVTPADPLSYAAAAAVLMIVGLGAVFGPAARAASADPAESLRAD